MTRRAQREEEERYLQWFIKYCPALEGAGYEPQDPPEPDFLVRVSGRRIGIELTEFVGSRRLRRLEGAQDAVVARARQLYIEAGGAPVVVKIDWTPGYGPSTAGDAMASYLLQLVQSNLPDVGEAPRVFQPDGRRLVGRRDYPFELITIARFADDPDFLLTSERSWWVAQADVAVLQAEIDRKNRKPGSYRSRYAERWLVLVHRGGQPSSGFDIPSDTRNHVYEASFDAVYVFGMTPPDVFRLRSNFPPAA